MIESGKVVVTFESADLSLKTKSYGVTISMKLLWQYFRMVRFVFQHSKKLKFAQFCWILTLATIWSERVKKSHGNLATDSTLNCRFCSCLFVCLDFCIPAVCRTCVTWDPSTRPGSPPVSPQLSSKSTIWTPGKSWIWNPSSTQMPLYISCIC